MKVLLDNGHGENTPGKDLRSGRTDHSYLSGNMPEKLPKAYITNYEQKV